MNTNAQNKAQQKRDLLRFDNEVLTREYAYYERRLVLCIQNAYYYAYCMHTTRVHNVVFVSILASYFIEYYYSRVLLLYA